MFVRTEEAEAAQVVPWVVVAAALHSVVETVQYEAGRAAILHGDRAPLPPTHQCAIQGRGRDRNHAVQAAHDLQGVEGVRVFHPPMQSMPHTLL